MSIQLNVNVKTVSGSVVTTVGAAPSATNDDFMRGSSASDVIFAGDGNDRVWAGGGADIVDGGAGDDILFGEGGNDVLIGGNGNDRLSGGSDDDVLHGDAGNDWLWGGVGNDILNGGEGNDLLWGESGNDILNGGVGNDMLNGGAGNDTLTGGAGADRFEYWINNAQKSVNFQQTWGSDVITDFQSGSDKLDLRWLFERLDDAKVAQILAAADSLVGPDGKYNLVDIAPPGFGVVKVGGATSLVGEFDTLNGDELKIEFSAQDINGAKQVVIKITNLSLGTADAGAVIRLDGVGDLQASDFLREGMKVVHGGNEADEFIVNFGDKGARIFAFGGDDVATGTTRTDWISGGDGKDTISGGAGSDWLSGDNGDDVINGDTGNDSLLGGAGADTLRGGEGNDFLYGGVGNDTLNGGAGADTFIVGGSVSVDWVKGTAFFNVDTGAKTIQDFARSQGDKIRFADFVPSWSLQSSDLRQKFVNDWFTKHSKVDGLDLVISGDNNGAAAGGEWSVRVVGGKSIFEDLTDGSFNWSDYFSFGG